MDERRVEKAMEGLAPYLGDISADDAKAVAEVLRDALKVEPPIAKTKISDDVEAELREGGVYLVTDRERDTVALFFNEIRALADFARATEGRTR